MTRAPKVRRITPLGGLLLLALVGVVVAFLFSRTPVGLDPEGSVPGAPRLPREFKGLVRAGDAPAAGARVRLYEDFDGGFSAEAVAAADGTFTLAWKPTLAIDVKSLYVAAWDEAGKYAKTIVEADPSGTVVDLAEPAEARGRVVGPDGSPVVGARVVGAVAHSFEEAALAVADDDGRFVLPAPVPKGAPLDLLVRAPGRAVRLERRFRGGDVLTLHVALGRDAGLRLIDPMGRPVAGARARLAAPRLFAEALRSSVSGPDGRVLLENISDGSRVTVEIEAQGFLPADAPAWPGVPADVVLWPGREVDVVAWDAWNARGVEGVEFDVDPAPQQGEEWWGRGMGSVEHRVAVRPGTTGGSYVAMLPTCASTLHLEAGGYGEGWAKVQPDTERVTVRLQPPMSRDKPSALSLRAPASTPTMLVVVADEEGNGFLRRVLLKEGSADVVVPPGLRLQVGSAAAAEGVFLPKHVAEALLPGKSRTLRLGTRPAHRLKVTTIPPVDGQAALVATELARHVAPVRVPVKNGVAEFWVAPFRKYHLVVTVPAGYFPHEAEVDVVNEDLGIDFHLAAAAQLRYRVRDVGQNPVPFARVVVYEPGPGGRMALETTPHEALTDADGLVRFDALRRGDAAVEFEASLLRGRRVIAKLPASGILDGGTLDLEPAPIATGTVVDPQGAPVEGVQVRALAPAIAWLPLPGGGTRELYDLTEHSTGDAVTDARGVFSAPVRSPGPPLIAFYPTTSSSLSPMAFEPGERYVLEPAAYVELEVPGSPTGVYLLVGQKKALLVKTDPPLSLRPLPLLLPAGRSSLYVKLRDGRWGAQEIDLKAGESVRLELDWRK